MKDRMTRIEMRGERLSDEEVREEATVLSVIGGVSQ